jgi:hypothetical protein
VGPLTVVSTHAEVDAAGPRSELGKMLEACGDLINAASSASSRVRLSRK